MSDSVNVSKKVSNLDIGNEQPGYAGVIIYTGQDDSGNDICYEAGDTSGNSGLVMEFRNEFGTQAMANKVLSRLTGWEYQPYEATGAHVDPAAEIGDGITISGIYSAIYNKETNFSTQMLSSVSAPTNEEIEHELTTATASDRQYTRFVSSTKASLAITESHISAEVTARQAADSTLSSRISVNASDIQARVTKTGGSSSSFGWTLTDSQWTLSSNNNVVFKVNSSGAEVTGTIKASAGEIAGFNIGSNAIWKNISYYGQTSQSSGIYLGTDGIQCGTGFKADSYGNVTAKNLTLSGGSIAIGAGVGTENRFIVDSLGNVTAKNLTLSGGSININNGAFQVTSAGAVTASNLTISGGSININNGNFSVNSSGNLTANNATLTGTLSVGGQSITADVLRSGAQSAYSNGEYWSTGANYGSNFNTMATYGTSGSYKAGHIWTEDVNADNVYCGKLWVDSPDYEAGRGNRATWHNLTVITGLSYENCAINVYKGLTYVGQTSYYKAKIGENDTHSMWYLGYS